MPLLLIGLLGFGGGFWASSGVKSMTNMLIIGGVAYFVFFTPSGQKILKKVTG
jgi:hypothetical protein